METHLENWFGRWREFKTSSISSGSGCTLESERVGSSGVSFVSNQPGINHKNVARREPYSEKVGNWLIRLLPTAKKKNMKK